MKRSLLLILSLLAILPFTFLLMPGPGSVANFPLEKDGTGPGDPAWNEQVRRMKGTFPSGWSQKMHARSAMNKTAAVNLTAVQEVGPSNVGGRTRALLIDVTNPNRYLAGGISGGVWESKNAGGSWSPVDDQAMTLSVSSLVQDALSPNLVYYGSGEPRGNSAGIPGSGVFRSQNFGNSFSQLASTANDKAFERIWQVKTDPLMAGILYVGTADSGLYKSVDSGGTFSRVFMLGDKDVTDIEVFPNGSLLIAVRDTGIFQSSSGNPGSFSLVAGGLPVSGFRRIELAFCDSFPNYVYAQFEDGSLGTYNSDLLDIYGSTDGGATWSIKDNPADFSSLGARYAFPWYCFSLGVKPDDPLTVVSGCVDQVYSTDGGSNWDFTSFSHSDYHVALFDPSNNSDFLCGNDGGIYRYSISASNASNVSLNNAYNVTQFYTGFHSVLGVQAYAGAQDNGTNSTTNGNPSFKRIFGGDGSYCGISQQNPDLAYISYQRGRIFRATNASNPFPNFLNVLNQLDGDNSNSVDDGAWFINPFQINLADGEQVYFVTEKRLWRTTNRANDWAEVTNDVSTSSESAFMVGISNELNPIAYLGGEGAMLYRIDLAKTAVPGSEVWLGGSVPGEVTDHFISCIEVSPDTNSVIFVSFSDFADTSRIWKVTDATSNSPVWHDISGDLPLGLPVNWVEVDPKRPDSNFVVATDYGVYSTVNAGLNWQKETDIPNVSVHMLRLRETDRKLFIFTHGRGMWVADMPLINASPGTMLSGIDVFPNPVTGPLNVRNRSSAELKFELYDVSGREMAKGHVAKGDHKVIDLAGKKPGVYLLLMEQGNETWMKKIIKF